MPILFHLNFDSYLTHLSHIFLDWWNRSGRCSNVYNYIRIR